MTDTFTCAACGETYPKERPDEEALAESKLIWGDQTPDDLAVICDDCFQRGFAGEGLIIDERHEAPAERSDRGFFYVCNWNRIIATMTEDSGTISLDLLGKLLKQLVDDVAEIKTIQAADHSRIENIEATLTRMHADMVDAKATGASLHPKIATVQTTTAANTPP